MTKIDTSSAKTAMIVPYKGIQLRIVTDNNGRHWFVVKDIVAAMGYADTKQTLGHGVAANDRTFIKINTAGGPQDIQCVNEHGLVALLSYGKNVKTTAVKRYLLDEVLPMLKANNNYLAIDPAIETRLENQEAEIVQLKERLSLLEAKTMITTTTAAPKASKPKIDLSKFPISAKELHAQLESSYQFSDFVYQKIKNRTKHKLVEGVDYVRVELKANVRRGIKPVDYLLTPEAASVVVLGKPGTALLDILNKPARRKS